MTLYKNPDFPCYVYFCGGCDRKFNSPQALSWHRERNHPVSYTCLLCDPAHKQLKNSQIKHHLEQVHGVKGFLTCGCCHYILKNRQELGIHLVAMRSDGKPGIEQILAKSSYKPGSLLQRNLTEKYEAYAAKIMAEQPTVLPPKQSSTTKTVRKSKGDEDKENISSPPPKKVKTKKPSVDTPEFKHAQEFFQNYMIPVLTKFHEEKMAVPKKE